MIRDHDQAFKDSLSNANIKCVKLLKNDLSNFNRRLDLHLQLLETAKDEMKAIAEAALNYKSNFKTAVNAAYILDRLGDPNAYKWIVTRFLKNLPADQKQHNSLFDDFDNERLVSDLQVVSALKNAVDLDAPTGSRAEWVLFGTGIDTKPLVGRRLREAKSDVVKNDNALSWLIRKAPSVEVLQLVETYFENTPRNSQHLAIQLLRTDFNDRPELQKIRDRIELALGEYTNSVDMNWNQKQIWYALVAHGSKVSKDLFLQKLRIPLPANFTHQRAAAALIRLGLEKDCEPVLRDLITQQEKLKAVSKPSEPNGLLLSEAPTTTRNVKRKGRASLGLYQELAKILEGSSDPEFTNLLLEKLYCDGVGWFSVEALHMLEQVGFANVAELWKQLAPWQLKDYKTRFFKTWHTKNHGRQDLVDWINQYLQIGENKISVQSVIDAPRYWPTEYTWKNDASDVKTHYSFAIHALAHSDRGSLSDGVNWMLDNFNNFIVEILPEDDKGFRLTSYSMEVGQLDTFRIVINGRMYEFQFKHPDPEWEFWFDVRCATDILNTIASRHGCKRRFFVYDAGYNFDLRLVLFIEPRVAKQLKDKFNLEPIESCLEQ